MRIEKPKKVRLLINDYKSTKKTADKTTASKKATILKSTVRLNVNVPLNMYRQLKIKAAQQDISVSRAVIGLIENYIARK